jgi:hypothetical protein
LKDEEDTLVRKPGWLAGMLGGLLVYGVAGAQQSPSAQTADVFADNPQMAQKVSVQCEGMAVGELLALLSQKTGVELAADKWTADDKVIAFSRTRPLKVTLTDLAALFNDAWTREKSGNGKSRYLLTRNLRARAYEESLLKTANNRLIAQLDVQVKALAETPEQLAQRSADDPIRKNLTDAGAGPLDGLKRTATQVYAALTPMQREDLFARKWVNFPVSAINPQLAEPVHKLYQEAIHLHGRFIRPEDGPQPEEKIEDYERRGVQFALHSSGGKMMPAVQVFGNGSMRATFFAELDARRFWPLSPHGNPYTLAPVPRTAPLPDVARIQEALREKNWVDRLHTLAALTARPIIADFYRSQPVNAMPEDDKPVEENKPLPENVAGMDTLCRREGYLWWTHADGALLFRKRDWYEQRQYEVSDSWLNETAQRIKAQNNLPTLADFLRVRDLTARQLLGLNSLYLGPNYSYSECETAGTRELLAFLERQLRNRPIYNKPLKPGEVQNKLYVLEPPELAPMQDALLPFLSAQSRPLSFVEARFFRVDGVNQDRSPAPDGGFKDAALMLMWNLGNGVDERQTINLPLAMPDDRRDKTKIEIE